MKPPIPQTKRAILPSYGCDRATPHTYVRTDLEYEAGLGDLAPQWAFIFRCDETGIHRQWGLEDARPGATS